MNATREAPDAPVKDRVAEEMPGFAARSPPVTFEACASYAATGQPPSDKRVGDRPVPGDLAVIATAADDRRRGRGVEAHLTNRLTGRRVLDVDGAAGSGERQHAVVLDRDELLPRLAL